jgi:hypothetical protein
MSRFIDNPRRAPRVPVRLPVAVSREGERWQAVTEDFGPAGCLIAGAHALEPGSVLRLDGDGAPILRPLAVGARVAWVTGENRIRAGVEFEPAPDGAGSDPADWFQRLLRARPSLGAAAVRVPARLGLDVPLYLLPPPQYIIDFSREELEVLRHLGNGMTVERLLARLGDGAGAVRMVFALLERKAFTLAMGEACPEWRWRPVLQAAGLSPAPSPDPAQPKPAGPVEAPLPLSKRIAAIFKGGKAIG